MGNESSNSKEEVKTTHIKKSHSGTINKKLSTVQKKLYNDYMGLMTSPDVKDPEYDCYKKLTSSIKDYYPKKKQTQKKTRK